LGGNGERSCYCFREIGKDSVTLKSLHLDEQQAHQQSNRKIHLRDCDRETKNEVEIKVVQGVAKEVEEEEGKSGSSDDRVQRRRKRRLVVEYS